MAMTFAGISKPFAATRPAARKTCPVRSRAVLQVSAKASTSDASSSPVAAAVSAFAASLLLLSSTAPAAVAAKYDPAFNKETSGREETRRLVEKGTPEVAKSGPMQTNIPFQAPGSNAAPRGQAQEGGTTAAAVVKNAAKQIKQNAKEGPSNKPFGIGRGPLVRGAQKMNQPGSIERVKEAPTEVYKQQSSLKKEKEAADLDRMPRGYYRVYDKITKKINGN